MNNKQLKVMTTQESIRLENAINYIKRQGYAGRTIDNLQWSNTYDQPILEKLQRAWKIVRKYSK